MDVREIYFRQQERKKKRAEEEKVHLVCNKCGEKVTRPVLIKLTGHLHDQTCTYICTVCRGTMKEVNLNQDEEK